jgi:hypothetical protein
MALLLPPLQGKQHLPLAPFLLLSVTMKTKRKQKRENDCTKCCIAMHGLVKTDFFWAKRDKERRKRHLREGRVSGQREDRRGTESKKEYKGFNMYLVERV